MSLNQDLSESAQQAFKIFNDINVRIDIEEKKKFGFLKLYFATAVNNKNDETCHVAENYISSRNTHYKYLWLKSSDLSSKNICKTWGTTPDTAVINLLSTLQEKELFRGRYSTQSLIVPDCYGKSDVYTYKSKLKTSLKIHNHYFDKTGEIKTDGQYHPDLISV